MNKGHCSLKLQEDFFDDDTILWLEEQPNGIHYVIFYLKLCLKSISSNGYLVRRIDGMLVPYDVEELAELTNTEIDTAQVAMGLFRRIGLVEILDTGEIYINQIDEMGR